jgi:2-methylcitrate synthase
MADAKTTDPKAGAGLRGVVAGTTSICTVGAGGDSLRYRGYDVEDLAEHAIFEEVAYLLLYGELPTRGELESYQKRLRAKRSLPSALKEVLERIPPSAHPMTCCAPAARCWGRSSRSEIFCNRTKRPTGFSPRCRRYWATG